MNNKFISIQGSYEDCINFITDENIMNYLKYNKNIDHVFINKGEEGRKASESVCMIDMKKNLDVRRVIIRQLTENHLLDECFEVSFG